jgi:hypothetical protein
MEFIRIKFIDMKTKLIIAFLLITNLALSQENKIKTSGIFETGYEDRRTLIFPADTLYKIYGVLPVYDLQAFYGHLYFDATYKGLKVYTSDKTWFNKDRSIYFNPMQIEYKIGASYTIKAFVFGYEHMCNHTIEGKNFADSYDRLYLRVKLF